MIKITHVKYLRDFQLQLTFSDGTQGTYDFSEWLRKEGPLVRPLRDQAYFKQVYLELGALCWANGLELSPTSIYRQFSRQNLSEPQHQVA